MSVKFSKINEFVENFLKSKFSILDFSINLTNNQNYLTMDFYYKFLNQNQKTSMNRVITVANQKGGVGKTDLVVNLSSLLAGMGKRVLLIDFDPQANASYYLAKDSFRVTTADVLLDGIALDDIIVKSVVKGLDIAPASIGLSAAQLRLASDVNMQFKLKKALTTIKNHYDYILIDTPPSLGPLTINAFAAADGILVPVQTHFFPVHGLSDLLKTVDELREVVNPNLQFYGIVLTMYDRRTRLAKDVQQVVTARFNGKVFKTVIPVCIKLAEAPSHRKPIILYAPSNKIAKVYTQLTEEFLQRLEN